MDVSLKFVMAGYLYVCTKCSNIFARNYRYVLYYAYLEVYLVEYKELKRLMAYAGSSANLLSKLISEDHNDSYRWEVSLTNLLIVIR